MRDNVTTKIIWKDYFHLFRSNVINIDPNQKKLYKQMMEFRSNGLY